MSRSSARCPLELAADLVRGVERRAGELELPAGLERDRGAGAEQRDERAARRLALGLPAVALDQRLEDGETLRSPSYGSGAPVVGVDAELLGLGADAVARLGLDRLVERDEEHRRARCCRGGELGVRRAGSAIGFRRCECCGVAGG